jgi:hypothetical protein
VTKKDYIATAKILKAEKDHPASGGAAVQLTVERLAHAFADMFQNDNSRFDRARFLQACGVQD